MHGDESQMGVKEGKSELQKDVDEQFSLHGFKGRIFCWKEYSLRSLSQKLSVSQFLFSSLVLRAQGSNGWRWKEGAWHVLGTSCSRHHQMGDEEWDRFQKWGGGSEVKVTCSLRNIQQGYMLNTRPKLCESGVTHTALIAQVVGLQGDVSVGKVFALQG